MQFVHAFHRMCGTERETNTKSDNKYPIYVFGTGTYILENMMKAEVVGEVEENLSREKKDSHRKIIIITIIFHLHLTCAHTYTLYTHSNSTYSLACIPNWKWKKSERTNQCITIL